MKILGFYVDQIKNFRWIFPHDLPLFTAVQNVFATAMRWECYLLSKHTLGCNSVHLLTEYGTKFYIRTCL